MTSHFTPEQREAIRQLTEMSVVAGALADLALKSARYRLRLALRLFKRGARG